MIHQSRMASVTTWFNQLVRLGPITGRWTRILAIPFQVLAICSSVSLRSELNRSRKAMLMVARIGAITAMNASTILKDQPLRRAIPTSPPTMAHSTTLVRVPVPATRKLISAAGKGGRRQGPEAMAMGNHAEGDDREGRDRAQVGQEPPDHHQRHTHARQDGGGREFDRP